MPNWSHLTICIIPVRMTFYAILGSHVLEVVLTPTVTHSLSPAALEESLLIILSLWNVILVSSSHSPLFLVVISLLLQLSLLLFSLRSPRHKAVLCTSLFEINRLEVKRGYRALVAALHCRSFYCRTSRTLPPLTPYYPKHLQAGMHVNGFCLFLSCESENFAYALNLLPFEGNSWNSTIRLQTELFPGNFGTTKLNRIGFLCFSPFSFSHPFSRRRTWTLETGGNSSPFFGTLIHLSFELDCGIQYRWMCFWCLSRAL